jgi:hypothetical protein
MYHFRALTSAAQLPVALADHIRGNLGSGCLHADVAKQARLPITNNTCPHINAELLLMFTQYSFSYNSQIKCFRTNFDMNIVSCFCMWNSCQKLVLAFQLRPAQ